MDTTKSTRHERLKKMLLQMRAESENRVRQEWAQKRAEVSNFEMRHPMDEGDLSNFELMEGIQYELLNVHYKTLKDVDLALQRLEAGTYGICEDCGRQISENRLRALPFALNCFECQEEREKILLRQKKEGFLEKKQDEWDEHAKAGEVASLT